VLGADIATFDAILTGRMNAMAAVLRGALVLQGKVVLLTALQRLFPGSCEAPVEPAAGYARRQS
jgi:putative sterol carrier protein